MSDLTRTEPRPTWQRAGIQAAGFVAFLWLLEIVDALTGNRLDSLGVEPRTDEGLRGILFAPVLHAGWGHLIANTVPLLILGYLVFLSGLGRGLAVTAIVWVVGGLGVWLFAPAGTVHLGASVLVFGWLVYLMLRGLFNARPTEILLGVVLFLLYGSTLVFGVMPGQEGVSWQGHLFGAVGGGLAAFLLGRNEREER